jgi:hypothetical protein
MPGRNSSAEVISESPTEPVIAAIVDKTCRANCRSLRGSPASGEPVVRTSLRGPLAAVRSERQERSEGEALPDQVVGLLVFSNRPFPSLPVLTLSGFDIAASTVARQFHRIEQSVFTARRPRIARTRSVPREACPLTAWGASSAIPSGTSPSDALMTVDMPGVRASSSPHGPPAFLDASDVDAADSPFLGDDLPPG